jgi:peptidoglycan/LPS O-acetylase OafA/YrhL
VLLTACGPDLPGVLLGHFPAFACQWPVNAAVRDSDLFAGGRGGLLARLLSLPTLVLLGEASYGIYILQIPVSYLLRQPPPYIGLNGLDTRKLKWTLLSRPFWGFVS